MDTSASWRGRDYHAIDTPAGQRRRSPIIAIARDNAGVPAMSQAKQQAMDDTSCNSEPEPNRKMGMKMYADDNRVSWHPESGRRLHGIKKIPEPGDYWHGCKQIFEYTRSTNIDHHTRKIDSNAFWKWGLPAQRFQLRARVALRRQSCGFASVKDDHRFYFLNRACPLRR